jgi:hypothetical protein
MAPSSKPFKPQDTVYNKAKPHQKGVIVQATTGGKRHQWDVRFEEDPEGIICTLKSQQLLRSKPKAAGAQAATSSATTSSVTRTTATATTARSSRSRSAPTILETTEDSSSSSNEDEVPAAPPAANTNDSSNNSVDDFRFSSDEEEEDNEPDQQPPPPVEDHHEQEEEEEPEEEDIPNQADIPVEPEDVHRNKWRKYLQDKETLLAEGWIVSKSASSNDGINIGAIVKTRGRYPREGTVVDRIKVGPQKKKHWLIDFGGEDPEAKTPMQVQLVEQGQVQEYVWKLVPCSEPDEGTAPEEYADGVGLSGFNFPDTFKLNSNSTYTTPYLQLLQKMWPGDWKQQLQQLNKKIDATNAAAANGKQKINAISEHDWWKFIGILISAGPQGKGGCTLWEKETHRERCLTKTINYGPDGDGIMPFYRFKEIKAAFPWSFQDKSKEPDQDGSGGDPWHICLLMVDGYNKKRHDWIAASVRKVLDESMSAFKPQTTTTGNLPHLSFILRKPEPLGTEFKTIACTVTGKKQQYVIFLLPSLLFEKGHRGLVYVYILLFLTVLILA